MAEEPNSPEAVALLEKIQAEMAGTDEAWAHKQFRQWLTDVYALLFFGWFVGGAAVAVAIIYRGLLAALAGAAFMGVTAALAHGRLRWSGPPLARPLDARRERSLGRVAWALSASYFVAGAGVAGTFAYNAFVPCEWPLDLSIHNVGQTPAELEIAVWNASGAEHYFATVRVEAHAWVTTGPVVWLPGEYGLRVEADHNRSAEAQTNLGCDSLSGIGPVEVSDQGILIQRWVV